MHTKPLSFDPGSRICWLSSPELLHRQRARMTPCSSITGGSNSSLVHCAVELCGYNPQHRPKVPNLCDGHVTGGGYETGPGASYLAGVESTKLRSGRESARACRASARACESGQLFSSSSQP